ncbi:tyrosine-type recombinase/integrase [Thermomonas sp.]|uniref:tyrosine-type recombinase/integrase n=1 Tax=Thermomonas sp. TaxID=1971895 RepID=UPI0035AFC816
MPRFQIDKTTVRNKLPQRREPYWGAPVERGLFVGFRRLAIGGNWIARFRTADGKQAYQSLGAVTAENDYERAKQEARRWRKGLEAGIRQSDVVTVADACRFYVTELQREKRDNTAKAAQQTLARTVLGDSLGDIKLDQLRERHLVEWRERLESGEFTPSPVKGGKAVKALSPPVFKRTLSTLKAALNLAVRKRYVSPDRAIEWKEIKPEKDADGRRDLYLDRNQRRALLEAADEPTRALMECIALTGCRPGDPAAALRKHYDAKTGSVTFITKGRNRTIPVSPTAKALLDKMAKGKLPMAYLFTQADGSPWDSRTWYDHVRAAVEKAGLPRETVLYNLRHSWITDAIIGGMDLLTVAKLTGTSLAMIEKHYGHLVQGAARDKLAKLDFV